MRRRKFIGFLLVLLTLAQGIIFLYRERFRYHPDEGLQHIYNSNTERWQGFARDNAADLPEAKRIADSVVGPERETTGKVLALAGFLHRKFYHRLGRPAPALLEASPLAQYRMLCGSDSLQLWCGNFAALFSLFCWSEGISCRTLEIMRPGDHHVLNEFYRPDAGVWAAVDLTHNLNLVAQPDGQGEKLSNASELTARPGQRRAFIAWSFRGDSLWKGPLSPSQEQALEGYYRAEYPVYYYHRTDTGKAYGFWNRLKEYFLPVSWYEILSGRAENNTLFYVKEILALLWLLTLLAWVVAKLKL